MNNKQNLSDQEDVISGMRIGTVQVANSQKN